MIPCFRSWSEFHLHFMVLSNPDTKVLALSRPISDHTLYVVQVSTQKSSRLQFPYSRITGQSSQVFMMWLSYIGRPLPSLPTRLEPCQQNLSSLEKVLKIGAGNFPD
jgi:hypothetical protein